MADARAGTLAYGQKQWLEIGMALVARPKVLLLDEPTAGMGPEETMHTVLGRSGDRLTRRRAVIEHDMEFVRALGARSTCSSPGPRHRRRRLPGVANDEHVRDVYLGRG